MSWTTVFSYLDCCNSLLMVFVLLVTLLHPKRSSANMLTKDTTFLKKKRVVKSSFRVKAEIPLNGLSYSLTTFILASLLQPLWLTAGSHSQSYFCLGALHWPFPLSGKFFPKIFLWRIPSASWILLEMSLSKWDSLVLTISFKIGLLSPTFSP